MTMKGHRQQVSTNTATNRFSERDWSARFVAEMLQALQDGKSLLFRWVPSVKVVPPEIDEVGPKWPVRFQPTPSFTVPEQFDLATLCRGIGKERAIAIEGGGELQPAPFWELDLYPYEKDRFLSKWTELPKSDEACHVAVLGGGDGAIQDALRFITNGLDARSILDKIERFLSRKVSTELASIGSQTDNNNRYLAFAKASLRLREEIDAKIKALIRSVATRALWRKLQELTKWTSIRIYFSDTILGLVTRSTTSSHCSSVPVSWTRSVGTFSPLNTRPSRLCVRILTARRSISISLTRLFSIAVGVSEERHARSWCRAWG